MSEEVAETTEVSESVPAPTEQGNWYDGQDFDDVTIGKIQTKGWESPADLYKSYESLEKFHGVPADQLMRLPQDGNPEAWGEIYERLGRPQHADQYKMNLPEGMQQDDELLGKARQVAFDNGMSESAFTNLTDLYNNSVLQEHNAFAESEANALEEQKANLKREWGSKLDEATFIADKAIRELGLDDDMRQILQIGMGYDNMYQMFNKIGNLISEKNPEDMDNTAGDFAKTSEQLRYEKDLIKATVGGDANKSARFNSSDNSVEYIRYQEIMRRLGEIG